MIDYMILAEKSSAAKKLAQALGGNAGTFDGHSYEIVHARGHLLTLDEPENLVASNKKRTVCQLVSTRYALGFNRL